MAEETAAPKVNVDGGALPPNCCVPQPNTKPGALLEAPPWDGAVAAPAEGKPKLNLAGVVAEGPTGKPVLPTTGEANFSSAARGDGAP